MTFLSKSYLQKNRSHRILVLRVLIEQFQEHGHKVLLASKIRYTRVAMRCCLMSVGVRLLTNLNRFNRCIHRTNLLMRVARFTINRE